MRLRRASTVAMAMLLGAMGAVMVESPAGAKSSIGTGVYQCEVNADSGTVTFLPAWSDTGTGKVKAVVHFTVPNTGAPGSCSGGNPDASGLAISGSGSFKFDNGSCDDRNGTGTGKLTFVYSGTSLRKSTVKGTFEAVSGGLGVASQAITVSGSYAHSGATIALITASPNGTTGSCSSGITSMRFGAVDLQTI